ncbi:MAG TPA: DUF5947 family protein [Chthoniobacterales bacterium]|nr:DUF5947 family protein [Chthoniobacterales bacterium]
MRSSSFATLRRFAGAPRPARKRNGAAPPQEIEQCELCSIRLAPTHRHLLEMATRRIVCACDPCALRFENVLEGKFKLIPRDARPLPDFQMSDAHWEALSLPISLAFFFYDTPNEKMAAYYPSPAGATESLLSLTAWEALLEANPILREMRPDVETLLVNRVKETREYFVAPIDLCFELVGLIRIHWRGFSGGEEVWREIDRFFSRLKEG